MQIAISKKTRRQLKKSAKAFRKALKRVGKKAGRPTGIAAGALTLGGLAAAVVMDPTVRQRSRALLEGTIDFLRRGDESSANGALQEHTH